MLRHSTVGKNKPRQNDDFLYNDICNFICIFSCNFFLVLSKLGAKFKNFRLFFCAPRNIRCSSSLQLNIFAVCVCVCVFSRASSWFITKIIYNEENYNIFSRAFIFRCVSDAFGIALNERRYHAEPCTYHVSFLHHRKTYIQWRSMARHGMP